VDGVKYLDHKQCNVVFSEDTDKYGQTNIGAMLPGSRWNAKFQAQIEYDILPGAAVWLRRRASRCRLLSVTLIPIGGGVCQRRVFRIRRAKAANGRDLF